MPLRIAFDLDGVFADMEGELARHAELLFGQAATGSQQSEVGSQQSAVGSRQSQSPVGSRQSQSPVGSRQSQSAVGRRQPSVGSQKREALGPGSAGEAGATPSEGQADETSPSRLRITARQQQRLWDHVGAIDNFWETLKEIEPGSVSRLAALAVEKRWEPIFLTRRPATAGATSQVQSQRWLKAKGFPLPSVFVVQGSRGRIAASLALDIVVDDTPENCLDVMVDSKARAILVWRDDKQQAPPATKRLGIGIVKSVHDCLDILAQIDAPPDERKGMMDRVRRLLGLKEAAGT